MEVTMPMPTERAYFRVVNADMRCSSFASETSGGSLSVTAAAPVLSQVLRLASGVPVETSAARKLRSAKLLSTQESDALQCEYYQ